MANPALASAIARADERRLQLAEQLSARRADLPLRYWRQQAHFTTPAELRVASKALASGTAPMSRILERYGVDPAELAAHMGVGEQAVRRLLDHPRSAPLVMVDAEDALARTDAAAAQGRADAMEAVAADYPSTGPPTLRFYRPPGLSLGSTASELYALLWGLVERTGPERMPLDGIVVPKVEHPEEVDLLNGMLLEAEQELGLQAGAIRTAYLVESGWAASQLPAIARRAAGRLCALILGLADYSADLRLPAIATDHPMADWARGMIVNVAAGVGVPAIDGMTLAYPVADPALDPTSNRERFLERMALVYRDAVRARSLGMLGKWVGHPAQLFAVLLAFDDAVGQDALEAEAAKLAAYDEAVRGTGKGAMVIGGVMSDRATDRHARAILRQGVAVGRFDARRALALGVIGEDELAQALALGLASGRER